MTQKERWIVNGGCFICVFLILTLILVLSNKNGDLRPHKPQLEKDNYTQEQKDVFNALAEARVNLEKTKMEVIQLLNEAKASVIAQNLDTNVQTAWLPYDGINHPINTTDGKPILMGYRADGLVMWKNQ